MDPLVTNESSDAAERAAMLSCRFERASAEDIIRASCSELFPDRIAAVSSFGTEAAVLLHMLAKASPTTPVVFLETRKHFGETLSYVSDLTEKLGLGVIVSAYPAKAQVEAEDAKGTLCKADSDRCCHIRKTLPMMRALRPYQAYFTGRKTFQTEERQDLTPFEVYGRWIRINPLWNWTSDQLSSYFEAHDLPRHPLYSKGYLSVGCEPCTRPVSDGEDARAGRWADSDKSECGIHITPDGKVIRLGGC